MDILRVREGDEEELYRLFYNTIRKVNVKDYNEDQVQAWAPDDIDSSFIRQKFKVPKKLFKS